MDESGELSPVVSKFGSNGIPSQFTFYGRLKHGHKFYPFLCSSPCNVPTTNPFTRRWRLFLYSWNLGWICDLHWPVGRYQLWEKPRLDKRLCLRACPPEALGNQEKPRSVYAGWVLSSQPAKPRKQSCLADRWQIADAGWPQLRTG